MNQTDPVVYIAGLGVISAIGNNVNDSLRSLESREAGMGAISMLNTIHRDQLPVAEVKLSNNELARIGEVSDKLPRTALLSLAAAKEALSDAGLSPKAGLRFGFISANTTGGMDLSEN